MLGADPLLAGGYHGIGISQVSQLIMHGDDHDDDHDDDVLMMIVQ